MRRFAVLSVFAGALLLGAAPCFAQDRTGTFEISPFAGGYFGGRLYDSTAVTTAPGTTTTYAFLVPDDALAYGGRLAYNVTRHFAFEVDWTSSRADVRVPNTFGVSTRNLRVGSLRQNVYEANALFSFGRRRAMGYVGIGGGAAVEKRDIAGVNPAATGRFTANLSVGGKFFFVPRIGLRIDGRYRAINLTEDRNDSSCDHDDFCGNGRRRNWSYNGELTGGLVFAF